MQVNYKRRLFSIQYPYDLDEIFWGLILDVDSILVDR